MAKINESAIKTPGVYVNEIPIFPPSVAQVETAIPAFIGFTQKAENEYGEALDTVTPIRISSLKEYETYFGKSDDEKGIKVNVSRSTQQENYQTLVKDVGGVKTLLIDSAEMEIEKVVAIITNPSTTILYYSLRLYFDNGGGPCYIVAVNPAGANGTDDVLYANALQSLETVDEPTILVFPDAVLKLDEAEYYALVQAGIAQCVALQDRFTLADVHITNLYKGAKSPTVAKAISDFRDKTANDNLNYAAAYYPYLISNYDFSYAQGDVEVVIATRSPLSGEPIVSSSVDPDVKLASSPVDVALSSLKDTHSEIYHLVIAKISEKLSPVLPPSAAIAGIYARVDASRGVWKAPANVSVHGVHDLTTKITDQDQGAMNIDPMSGKSVNAIRAFQGKGFLVWGARTLAGNDNEWRYVSVRRLFITIEESARKATAKFVFEPNDDNTWVKLRTMLENYLILLWKQGALAGSKAEHAFYVRCGLNQTMTAQDILEGKLIVEMGLAAVRPAEFIVLRLSHKMQEP